MGSRIELSVKPCPENLRPGIRSLERSAKCAPHRGFALIASPYGHPARSKKNVPKKNNSKQVRARYDKYDERAGERPERTQAVGLKEWWTGLQLAERASEFTAAGRRAGLPNELHPKFELAKPVAVPNPSSNPSKDLLTSQSVVFQKTHPKL
jgi:hypothetical protein